MAWRRMVWRRQACLFWRSPDTPLHLRESRSPYTEPSRSHQPEPCTLPRSDKFPARDRFSPHSNAFFALTQLKPDEDMIRTAGNVWLFAQDIKANQYRER